MHPRASALWLKLDEACEHTFPSPGTLVMLSRRGVRTESDKFTSALVVTGLSSLPSAVWLVVLWRFSIATLVDAERRFYSV